MALYDVYRNPRKDSARQVLYLLDVQSEFLEDLDSRVVVPLRAAGAIPQRVARLNPVLQIDGAAMVMDTPQMVGYPRQALKRPVTNLGTNAFEIQNALDFLFAGI